MLCTMPNVTMVIIMERNIFRLFHVLVVKQKVSTMDREISQKVATEIIPVVWAHFIAAISG